VLVLTGSGMAAAVRLRTVPVLEQRFRVLVLQPGHPAGVPAGRLIARLADEAVRLLDAEGAAAAHVYGLSFGGLIAQELVLRHPERVRRLVLAATSAGGSARTPPDERTAEFIRRRARMPVDEGLWAAVPYSYALATRRRHAARIGEDIASRARRPVDRTHHRVGRAAVMEHDACDRLHAVSAPTLVLHGNEDRMVPPRNAHDLAALIPGAHLRLLSDAAHLYPTDTPKGDAEVVRFLDEPAIGRPPRRSGHGRATRA
jgi:pimeloyl-ACP methyl ester carboxylesterase